MRFKIFATFYIFIYSFHAFAYLDPASGSAILYVLISVVTASLFYFKNIAINFYNLAAVKFNVQSRIKSHYKIVFYSEGKQYWYVFSPILKWLSSQQQECLFLTSDKNDPVFGINLPGVEAKYIGRVNFAGAYLAQIKADFLGMTTPQLDVLTIKRSKTVKHYSHIVHAPIDIFTYRKFAFDYFDSVFCSGPHQIKSIRFLESLRKTKEKELLKVGCTYYDYLIENLKNLDTSKKNKPVILVAPTWKEYSMLHKYGAEFLHSILKTEKYEVILRPHPQMYISYPDIIYPLEEELKIYPHFSLDRAPTGERSMHRCDLMISDLSGIIWDYVFLRNRPVLIIETPLNLDGFEGTDFPFQMWELESISRVGRFVKHEEMPSLIDKIDILLKESATLNLKEFRDENLYNWGHAGEVAGKEILKIVSRPGV